ncbi:MAG: cupredoxin domain-containing protein [Anaerolineales bacterium]
MLKKFTFQLAVLASLGLLLVACSTPTKKVTLVAEDIMWSMETIEAKVNQPIEITIRNAGALDHDFVIAELDIEVLLSPGDIEVVEFTVDQAGTILYICNIPGHEEAGMVGQIVISE